MKLKSIKPSHKEKRRYLLILGKDAERKTLEKIILDYIGILGYAKAAPFFVKSAENKVVLAVNRKSLNDVRASFAVSKKKIEIGRVSGTLKGLG